MEAKNIGEVLKTIGDYFPKDSLSTFGLYFRGQSNYSHKLVPAIFRQGKNYGNNKLIESEMYREFKLLKSTQNLNNKSVFEWLIIMQHYGLPTRLLDWSQNLLVALYFAVDDLNEDAALFALEPISLNFTSDPNSGKSIFDHLNTQTIIRANLVSCNELKDLFKQSEIKQIIQEDGRTVAIKNDKLEPNWWQRIIQTPIAVRPPIQNDRIFLQKGIFTIHGGKVVGDKQKIEPLNIEDLNGVNYIKIKIPQSSKEVIKAELEYCGINESTLFPELDKQANYIKERWSK